MSPLVPPWLIASLAVGAAPFGLPVNVSRSGGNCFVPSLAVERQGPTPGAFRIFWHDLGVTPATIGCVANDGSGYGAPGACPIGGAASRTPRAVSDGLGRTHLAWRNTDLAGGDEIYYVLWDRVAWSTPVNLSSTPGRSVNPWLVVDAQDLPHVVWEEDTGGGAIRFFEAHFDGSVWSAAADTGLPYQGAAMDTVRMAADSTGTLHAVWQDAVAGVDEVYHAERPPGGPWGLPEGLSLSPAESSNEPAIGVGPDDVLHVVWAEQDAGAGASWEVVYSKRTPAVGWWPWSPVSNLGSVAVRPVLAVGRSDGEPRIAWTLLVEKEVFWVPAPGAPAVNVSESPGNVSERVTIDLDSADHSYLAWQEVVGDREIYAASTRPTGVVLKLVADRAGGDALLSWSGGIPPYHVDRMEGVPTAPPIELTPPSGIGGAAWSDPDVLGDGFTYFYVIR